MSRFLLEPCKRFVGVIFFGQKVNFTEVKGITLESQVERVLSMIRFKPSGHRTEETETRRIEILIFLFGLEDGQFRSLAEAKEKFGLSRTRISEIKNIILQQLHRPSKTCYLRPFICETVEEMEAAYKRMLEFEEVKKGQEQKEKDSEALRGLFKERFPTLNIRYINRIEKSGITLFDITQLSEEELVKKLGVTSIGSYTEQVLLKLRWHLLAKQRAS